MKPSATDRRRSGSQKLGSLDLDRPVKNGIGEPANRSQPQVATAHEKGPHVGVKGEIRVDHPSADQATAMADKGRGGQVSAAEATAVAGQENRGDHIETAEATAVAANGRTSGACKAGEGDWITRRGSTTGQMQASTPASQAVPSKQAPIMHQDRHQPVQERKHGVQQSGRADLGKSQHSQQNGSNSSEQQGASKVRDTEQQPARGDIGMQQQLKSDSNATRAERAIPSVKQAPTAGRTDDQSLGSAAAKSAQEPGQGSRDISQQSPERARKEAQMEGDRSVEGQSAGIGGRTGGWTGRLKSIFTLSGRGANTAFCTSYTSG